LIYLLFDNDHMEPVATEKQWQRMGDWSQSVSAPELHRLLTTARSDDLPALTEQIAAARIKCVPDPDIDDTLVKSLFVLESTSEVNSVMITDGQDDEPPVTEIVEKALQKHSAELTLQVADMLASLTQQVGLLHKSFADYLTREVPPKPPTVIQFNVPDGFAAALANWTPVTVSNVLPPMQPNVQPSEVKVEHPITVQSAVAPITVQPSEVTHPITVKPGEVTVKLERSNAHVEMQKRPDGKWVADIKPEGKR
jgi:hypothetical protein